MSVNKKSNTIVVIEDIGSITKLLSIILRKAGYEVATFDTGETACEWLRENEPLVVLCDIMLPGMHGEEVLSFIRTLPHGQSLHVIAVTALANPGDRDRLLRHGFTDHIAKPINPGLFISQIQQHLGL
ncbi:MAG: response regulator [Bacteroidia bacterium]|jgi:CheY-like chemotaxis protein|nr:response regulator [Bacteroidia bacterium]